LFRLVPCERCGHGIVPVSSSNSSTPVEYTSDRASAFASPPTFSGDMYQGVPSVNGHGNAEGLHHVAHAEA
jgi:hypothetical protein